MHQTKEQLMSDIALLIKAHDQEKSQDRLIRQEEKEIKHLILKQVKKKTMLMLLLPSLVMILISLFIYHSTSLMMIGLILLIVWFVKNKNIRPENKSITKSKGYKKAEKELKDQPDIQQHQHNIQRHQHTLTDIHHTVAASKAQQRIPKAYTHIHALRSMFSYLYNQRADTLKEAINLYETESHQARMEGQQQQILSTVTQTSVDAKAAKYASELATSNSQASAIWAERAAHSARAANENAAEASQNASAAATHAYKARKNTEK